VLRFKARKGRLTWEENIQITMLAEEGSARVSFIGYGPNRDNNLRDLYRDL
jgi:hypothetical protein